MSTKKAPLIYDKAMHEARRYWRDRLDAMSFDGSIALDHPRPKDGEQELSFLEQTLDSETNVLLQRLTAGNDFLLYTTLVLALRICCYKYGGRPNATIFCPANSESAIDNLLPISSTLETGSSFKDALLVTKDLLSSAYKYQQYPFSRMLLDLPDEHRPKHLFMIASMAGLNEGIPESNCDILVRFRTIEKSTRATFRFDRRLYRESTVLHFFESFGAILRQGLSRMATRIADLSPQLVVFQSGDGASDSAQVLATSNIPAVVGEDVDLEDVRVHRLIEAEAAKHSESVAVVEGDRVTTYRTLNQHAERLAETLIELRLDLRKPVVILMDAGAEMVVSMLAAMKLGAAFAPVKLLSIKAPVPEILKLLNCECIICQREQLKDLQQFRDSLPGIKHGIAVELSAPAGADEFSSLEITRDVSSAACINGHFAGETSEGYGHSRTACVLVDGREDGLSMCSVTHAELASLFLWLNKQCGISTDDRCLLSPGLAACEQLYDTLGMLMGGASVEISDAANSRDTSLAERLLAETITIWDLPTPLMQNLLAELLPLHLGQEHQRGPRNILLSGEKQSVSLADKLTQFFPNTRVTGLYANPAVGIWTTAFPLRHGSAEWNGTAIAQPIPGFQHQVLNKNGEPVPFYTKGELFLKRVFPVHDAELLPSSQTVKTGMRAEPLERNRMRWLRGDEHCFVKYGCCIELTKVEAILCQHEHIRAAEVITVRANHDDDGLVVAFVIADPDQASAEAVRDFLVLHDQVDLIPDRFILLEEFPLTADGAIDRDVLIRRFIASHEARIDTRGAEAEEIHRQLKEIWLEALQLDDIDDDDSFFARGGNSLKATLLIARIRDEFSVELSVQDFFRKPTTRAVAQLIQAESKNVKNRQKGPDFKPVSREKYRVQLAETES